MIEATDGFDLLRLSTNVQIPAPVRRASVAGVFSIYAFVYPMIGSLAGQLTDRLIWLGSGMAGSGRTTHSSRRWSSATAGSTRPGWMARRAWSPTTRSFPDRKQPIA